jgi:hypothetical protein
MIPRHRAALLTAGKADKGNRYPPGSDNISPTKIETRLY